MVLSFVGVVMEELLFARILKGLAEAVLMIYMARAVLWGISGFAGAGNPVLGFFVEITSRMERLARFVTPKMVKDSHLWMAVLGAFFFLWVFASGWKVATCVKIGVALCK